MVWGSQVSSVDSGILEPRWEFRNLKGLNNGLWSQAYSLVLGSLGKIKNLMGWVKLSFKAYSYISVLNFRIVFQVLSELGTLLISRVPKCGLWMPTLLFVNSMLESCFRFRVTWAPSRFPRGCKNVDFEGLPFHFWNQCWDHASGLLWVGHPLSFERVPKCGLHVEYNGVRQSSVESRFRYARTKVGYSGTSRGLLFVAEVKLGLSF